MAYSFSEEMTIRGHKMGEVRSALQKAIRRGQEDQALYWATEIVRSGYEKYLWRTLLVITAEDVGLAEPTFPGQIYALYGMWETLAKQKNPNRPERLFWTQAVFMLSRAKKSRIIDDAMNAHWGTDERVYEVPDEALDPHTRRGRQMGKKMPDYWETSFHLENADPDLLPDPSRPAMNAYTQAAIDAPAGEFAKVKPTVLPNEPDPKQTALDLEAGYVPTVPVTRS